MIHLEFLCVIVHMKVAQSASEVPMLRDLAMVVLAIAVIGWNLGSWWIPAAWIALVCVAVALANVRRDVALRRLRRLHSA